MPLRGTGHSKLVGDQDPYFSSLADLDVWATVPRRKLNGLLTYKSRRNLEGAPSDGRGKLLVKRTMSSIASGLG
jgi:mannosyl-glycoprotein endo-beta-N-acetylglucosaminidase